MGRDGGVCQRTGFGTQLKAQLRYSLSTGSGRPVETIEIETGCGSCTLFNFLYEPQNHRRR